METDLVKDLTRCPFIKDGMCPCNTCDDPHDISPPCYVPASQIEERKMKFRGQIVMSSHEEAGQIFIQLGKALNTLAGIQQPPHATDSEGSDEAYRREVQVGQEEIDETARQVFIALTGYDPGTLMRDWRHEAESWGEPTELVSAGIPGKKFNKPVMLTNRPRCGNPPSFITIIEGTGGWNSACFRWVGSEGYYDVMGTGLTNTGLGTRTKEDAIREAKDWADHEGVPVWIPPDV